MRHISITSKFLILLACVGFFVIGATAYSGHQMLRIDGLYRGLLEGEDTAVINLARSNRSMQAARASIGDLLLVSDQASNERALAEMTAARTSFISYIDAAIAALPEDADLPLVKASGLKALDETCRPVIEQAARATSPDDVLATQQRFLTECQPVFPVLSKVSVDVGQKLIGLVAATNAAVSASALSTVWNTSIAILLGLGLFLLLGLAGVRKWLASPLRGLSETMKRLADADYTAVVSETDRRDEVGAMARAVQVFKDNGLRAIEVEREASEHRGKTEEERRRNAEAERRRVEDMTKATDGLASGLKHLAQGDLRFSLDTPFASEFEGLRTDFNAAVSQLGQTLVAVTHATSSIDAGSREVSRSADDLSKRTEQQAASLEETAAALDEITVNVSNASKRTEEARSVAAEAEGSADHSAKVVARAVDAIEKIEDSSRQISSIIGVIDDIAFQTNLLALNAGVEAARAGEAGKGFAVVAQEVRELAQRSAHAAKEIKDLIRTSEAEVASGVALVRETGGALETIRAFVGNINQLMDAIAVSAKEQSAGLTQVNTAVNEMDQVTQKNAAMVEEANAASATLAIESNRLQTLVAAFALPGAAARAQQEQAYQTAKVSPLRSAARRGSAAQAVVEWEDF